MNIFKKARKAFVPQINQNECGAVCLLMMIKFYGGDNNIATLKDLTNTSSNGCSLLDILHAANGLGLNCEAFELENDDLSTVNPGIIQIITEEGLAHFCAYFGLQGDCVILGDPAKGILSVNQQKFFRLWRSKIVLELAPRNDFLNINHAKHDNKLKRIIQSLIPFKGIILSIIFLSLISCVISLSSPLFSKVLIDMILPMKDINVTIIGVLSICGCLLIGVLLNFVLNILVLRIATKYTLEQTESLWSSLLTLPKKIQDAYISGDIISRFRELDYSGNAFSLVSSLINSIFFFLFSAIVIAYFSWKITVATLMVTIIYVTLSILFALRYKSMEKNRQVSLGYFNSSLNSYLTNLDYIRYSSIKPNESSLLQRKSKYLENYVCISKYHIDFSTIFLIINIAYICIVMLTSINLYLQERIVLGSLVALLSYSSMLYPHIQNIFSSIPIIIQTYQSLCRAFEFDRKPYTQSEDELLQELLDPIQTLEVNNLSLSLRAGRYLFENICFKLNRGDCLVIQGSNGSGKTSLLHTLIGGYNHYEGEIRYNGCNLKSISRNSITRKVGVVLQKGNLIEGSIKENIFFGEEPNDEWLSFLINQLQLSKFFNRFRDNIDTIVDSDGAGFSLGEIKVILLLRSLYKKPDVLVLDEMLSSIDEELSKHISNIIRRISKQIILIIVTHDKSDLKDLDYSTLNLNTQYSF